jgi:hypothetical protein
MKTKEEISAERQLLVEKSESLYDSAILAKQKADEAFKNGQQEDYGKHMAEYWKLTKRHLNMIRTAVKELRDLLKEKSFDKAYILYVKDCEANGTIPDQPVLKDCTKGEKYFYLKKGKKVLAKFDNKLF